MQVLKKVCTITAILLLTGCNWFVPYRSTINTQSQFRDSISQIEETHFNKSGFRVGVLLPLSGDTERHGNGLKNAALMAYDDMKNPNLILQFYDTQGTPEGAREAAQTALNQKVQMIIGPLTSSSVQAISDLTKANNVPVVAFSTDSTVLQNQIYTLGLLVDEQVGRIVSYTAQKGRQRFALLIPNNNTGIAVARAAVAAAERNNARVVKIAFYKPDTTDFSQVIQELTNYKRLSQQNKKALPVDFDAVLIPESGARLKSAVAMFGYYDVFSPNVKFIGTSVWENTNLSKETTLSGSWYPALSRNHSAYFNKKYNSLFGSYPNSLYAFAYDAVALSSVIAKQNPYDINKAITNADGFVGISGVFRILESGKNEHSLDILEITKSGDVVVDLAAKKFYAAPYNYELNGIAESYDETPPLIFGKEATAAQIQIFGRRLGSNHGYENVNRGFLSY